MAKKIGIGILVVVVLVGGYVGWRAYQSHLRAMKAGVISENIVHDGDNWKVDYVARIPAPRQQVFGAMEKVEDWPKYSPAIKDVKVLSAEGNKKTVELTIEGVGGQTLPTEMAFEYSPNHDKILTTSNNPVAQTKSEFDLKDDGGSTLIDYHQDTHMNMQLPVPDAMVKQFMRTIFVGNLETIKKALNLNISDSEDNEDEEP